MEVQIMIKNLFRLYDSNFIQVKTSASNTLEFFHDLTNQYELYKKYQPNDLSIVYKGLPMKINEHVSFDLNEICKDTFICIVLNKK